MENNGNWKTDNNVFLFSIDLNKKYKLKNNQKVIYFLNGDIDPCFCDFCFEIMIIFYLKINVGNKFLVNIMKLIRNIKSMK